MIRTLLVDDEAPARDRLRKLLEAFDEIEIVGEAGDGDSAVRLVAQRRPDLVFLDIEMPGLNGMEVAATLTPPRPRVVFCTAYDQYAIEAFEHHAADYLLKPVNRRRLARTIERVRDSLLESRQRLSELTSASRTQQRLYPQSLPPMDGLDYAGRCRAARGVGGDYYDFLELGPQRLGIAVGDVSGKGIFAGLLMAGLQARLQSLAPQHVADLAEMLERINRSTHSATDSNRYATLFYALYDGAERSLRYVNAGHDPPLLLRRGAPTLRLEASGTAVGLLPDVRYVERTIELQPGDLLLAYTDGVTEALDPAGNELGAERLERWARRHDELSAAGMCDAILADVDRHVSGAPPIDDLTLTVARVG